MTLTEFKDYLSNSMKVYDQMRLKCLEMSSFAFNHDIESCLGKPYDHYLELAQDYKMLTIAYRDTLEKFNKIKSFE